MFSIITPTLNSSNTVADCVKSVVNQDYSSIEHIVIDGKSSDDTIDIVSRNNPACVVLSEKDSGIYDAMNKGIELSTGEVIGILNSDDFYIDDTVMSSVINVFRKTGADAVIADLYYINRGDSANIIRSWKSGSYRNAKWVKGWMPAHPTFFVKKSCYETYGLYDCDFRYSADYELMLRFLYKNELQVEYLNKYVVKMRLGGFSNQSINSRIQSMSEIMKAWKKNDLRAPVHLPLMKVIRKIPQYWVATS